MYSDILSDIVSGNYPDILSDILPGKYMTLSLAFYPASIVTFVLASFPPFYSGNQSCILSGIYSNILSFNILYDILHAFWHCILSGGLPGIYSDILCLAFYPAFCPAFYLTFSLACVRVQAWPASGAVAICSGPAWHCTGFSIIIFSIINVWGSTCWTCHGSTIQTRFFGGLWKYVCKCKYVVSTQLVAWQKETSRYYVYQWQALGAYTRSLDTYFL